MRIKSLVYYHMSTAIRGLLLLAGIVLAVMIIILIFMFPYLDGSVQTAEVGIGGNVVVNTTVESGRTMLGSAFTSPQSVYWVYILVMACVMATTERRYLLAHSISRYELTIGNFLSAGILATSLSVMQYLLDTISRAVTCMLGIQIVDSKWTAGMIFFGSNAKNAWMDGLGSLIYNLGAMLYIASGITLAILLFTRWKKTCITLCVASVVLPVLLVSFLPADWMRWVILNAEKVASWVENLLTRYNWLFLYNIPNWQAFLQLLVGGMVTYALSYLVLRKMPAGGK